MNRRAMTSLSLHRRLVLPLALAGFAALSACQGSTGTQEEPPLAGAAIGGPFTLTDSAGRTVRWSDFKGRYRTVYFGYTFCPDACPLDTQAFVKGFNLFAQQHPDLAAKVQPIFISVDPGRDTPEVVGQWTAAFSPHLLGLTGTQQQVDQAAKAFAAPHSKGEETGDGGYLMNHPRIVYLMGPEGEPIDMMMPEEDGPEGVAAKLAKWVK
jgi:protein SCO1